MNEHYIYISSQLYPHGPLMWSGLLTLLSNVRLYTLVSFFEQTRCGLTSFWMTVCVTTIVASSSEMERVLIVSKVI